MKGIYQTHVYDEVDKKLTHCNSEELRDLISEVVQNSTHMKYSTTLVEGVFRFIKDGKGGIWLDFRPVHPTGRS